MHTQQGEQTWHALKMTRVCTLRFGWCDVNSTLAESNMKVASPSSAANAYVSVCTILLAVLFIQVAVFPFAPFPYAYVCCGVVLDIK